MIYEWKEGSRSGMDAQKVGERLEKLRDKHDGLTAEIVVHDARSLKSPLHDGFQWDDERAAHEYRLEQARHIVRHIAVKYDETPDAEPVRAFVIVSVGDTDSYQSTYTVMSDPALRQQVLSRAYKELESWRRRYAELEEFAQLFSAIDQAKIAV